jgi:HSP20 family protein
MAERPANPFEGVSDFFSEMNRMRELGRGEGGQGPEERHRTHATAWVPATDILASGGDLLIRVEVAGVRPEDIDVTFSGGVLTVSGTRDTAGGATGDAFYIRERYSGTFRRAITLPPDTLASQISAEFDNGLVELTVRGGARGAEPQRIALHDRSGDPTTRRLG